MLMSQDLYASSVRIAYVTRSRGGDDYNSIHTSFIACNSCVAWFAEHFRSKVLETAPKQLILDRVSHVRPNFPALPGLYQSPFLMDLSGFQWPTATL